MITRKDVIKKIQKLIDLSNGTPFEKESESAMKKAIELMAEFDITDADTVDKIHDATIFYTESKSHDTQMILFAKEIANFNGVLLTVNKKRVSGGELKPVLKLYGTLNDIDSFKYIFNNLVQQINSNCENWWTENKTTKFVFKSDDAPTPRKMRKKEKLDYINGLYKGVIESLNMLMSAVVKYKGEKGLVPVSSAITKVGDIEKKLKETQTFRKMSVQERKNSSISDDGKKAAKDISINHRVSGQETRKEIST